VRENSESEAERRERRLRLAFPFSACVNGRRRISQAYFISVAEALMAPTTQVPEATAEVDDATLKRLQYYAVTAAERLGLYGILSASNGRVVALTIVRKPDRQQRRTYMHPYLTHDDAVQFINRMLEQASKAH
jgi:hypothetical protein